MGRGVGTGVGRGVGTGVGSTGAGAIVGAGAGAGPAGEACVGAAVGAGAGAGVKGGRPPSHLRSIEPRKHFPSSHTQGTISRACDTTYGSRWWYDAHSASPRELQLLVREGGQAGQGFSHPTLAMQTQQWVAQ